MSARTSDPNLDAVARIVSAIGTVTFPTELAAAVADVVPYDSCLILAASPGEAPSIVLDDLGGDERDVLHGAYMGGAYLVAAGYRTAQDTGAVGVRGISEIFPGDLRTSRYFAEYWGRTGMIDEAFVFFRPEGPIAVWFAFGRYAAGRRFSRSEIGQLRKLEPVLLAAGHRHWALMPPVSAADDWTERRHKRSQAALETFGQDVLTPREYDVCQLLLRGHSSKSAARVLDISPGTERIHRRRIFAKLGVSSQVEVLTRFVSMLSGDSPENEEKNT